MTGDGAGPAGMQVPAATRAAAFARLRREPEVPVLVVGAGINGAGTFRDLALQGVDCLLVDKGDWCAGTSAAPSRLIHGGLKYLETGEFRLVAESAHERNLLLRNAPHFVKPLPTVVPIRSTFGGIGAALGRFVGRPSKAADRGLLVIGLGLRIYDWFGRRDRVMPRHSVALRGATHRRIPGLDPAIRATATYYDARVTQAERLCFELVADGEAAHPGAHALNYVSLVGAEGGRVRLRDETTGESLEVRPRVVVNAAGPWIDQVNRATGLNKRYIGGTKGSHLLLDHPALVAALDGQMIYFGAADGRICLVYPFMGRALLGATDLRDDDPDAVTCDDAEAGYLLDRLRELFPGLTVTPQQIVYRYAGIRPLPATDVADPAQISRDHSIGRDQLPGSTVPVLSLIGGKWTTFRAFAADATDAVLAALGRQRRCSTADVAIGGGRDFPAGAAAWAARIAALAARFGVGSDRAAALLDRYGTTAEAILAAQGAPERMLSTLPGYGAGELGTLARRERVVDLADLVFRRTPIAVSETLTRGMVEEVAAVVAPVLGWPDAERRRQVDATLALARTRHGVATAV